MAETKKTTFDILNAVNVNEHTETKDTGKVKLTYLSWAWAWSEVKKRFPDAQYEIIKFNGLPYVFDEKTGFMVYTSVTIDGITHEMWLPVMDGNNRAMLDRPYEVKTKYSPFTVQPATMFDVNKAIQRSLTKAVARHGLGLYIYAGEDLPEDERTEEKKAKVETISAKEVTILKNLCERKGVPSNGFRGKKLEKLTGEEYAEAMRQLGDMPDKESA